MQSIISLHHSYFYLPVKPALRPKPRTERPYYSKDHRVAVDEDREDLEGRTKDWELESRQHRQGYAEGHPQTSPNQRGKYLPVPVS